MATIRDVAKKAGVSPATVSSVINGTKKISEPVTKRVHEAMLELDYRPNALARSLFRGKTHTIAFLVPSVMNPALSAFLHAIEAYANERDYSVFIANTKSSPAQVERYCNRLLEMRVDGVLITLTWELARQEVIDLFDRHGIPVVGCGGARTLDSVHCYLADETKAGYDLGRYLGNMGHRRCAYIGPSESAVGRMRLDGLMKGFASLGIDLDEELIMWTESYHEQGSKESTLRLLAKGRPFSCIVAFNDLIAAGALAVLQGKGFSVPGHVSMATFGDHYAHLTHPSLTTMTNSDGEIGRAAVTRLFSIITGQDDDPPAVHRVEKRLLIRDSCAVVPHSNAHLNTPSHGTSG